MIYKLKNSNYKTFETDKENVLIPRSYFIPFSDIERLADTDIRTERYNSDMVEVLSGEWDFAYYHKVSELPASFDTEKERFDKVSVPSCWQFTGYENPCYINARYEFKCDPPKFPTNCSVGVYRRFFKIEDTALNYTLSFLGVAGALDVFVNGRYVGYSEGSHNTSEFELNEFITEGENELVAVVHKFSNGTYLECQDMFRNNGIFRDVLLYKTGDDSIYDFEVKTEYDNSKYNLEILPSLKLKNECALTVSVPELEISKSVEVSPEGIEGVAFNGLEVEEWSAELPKLYTLLITLSREGQAVEIIRKNIGFKRIEIKGNIFCFNGKPIKLFGVNHHDTDSKKGFVMSVEDMERDIKIFKEYNVNCVRTSHYPPDPTFIDLCDEYGVYVVDEADIEAHGCMSEGPLKAGACSHNPKWKPRYLDRVMRMFERDKNHPSITMWSLGNEAWGYSNQDACYEALKKVTSIPVHYEGVVHTRRFAYDVISQMYPWQPHLKKLADGKGAGKKWYQKPYFLCEYAHAMGLGAGELETYVSAFLRGDNMMGGCIWEFADHAVYHEDGKYKYTYGGDHEEKKHDGNFCVDGLFYPDRTPHAGALQMKNCYRPVRARANENGKVEFKNLYYFKNAAFNVRWEKYSNTAKTAFGETDICIEPQCAFESDIDIKDCDTLVIRYYDGEREIAGEQLEFLRAPFVEQVVLTQFPDNITFRAEKDKIILNLNGIEAKLSLSVYRAPLDNDRYLNKVWERLALSTEHIELLKAEGNTFTYRISTKRFKNLAKVQLMFTGFNSGGIGIFINCLDSNPIPFAPRFGVTLEIPKEYENVTYFGLGDRQNLPDFREHALLGEYSCKVDDMREKYIMPQESSMRSGVRLAKVTNGEGRGICISEYEKPFIFSADRFTSQQCALAMHQEELELQDFTLLHIDSYQLGAASGICGPVPTKPYRKNSLKGLKLSFKVDAI